MTGLLVTTNTVSERKRKPSSSRHGQVQNSEEDYAGDEAESEDARIERLGRERPAKFKTIWAELGFCYSILASQFTAVS